MCICISNFLKILSVPEQKKLQLKILSASEQKKLQPEWREEGGMEGEREGGRGGKERSLIGRA